MSRRRRQLLGALGAGLAAPWVRARAPLRIVAIFPLSGARFKASAPFRFGEALQLAVEQLNGRGGIAGQSLELIELDSKSTPLGARAAAQEALRLAPLAVIGEEASNASLAMAQVLQAARVTMLAPIATLPELTQVGDCIFRMCASDRLIGRALVRVARQEMGAERAAVLVATDQKVALELGQQFATGFRAAGGAVVLHQDYFPEASEHGALLTRLRAARPDLLFLPGTSQEVSAVLKPARALGITAPGLSGDSVGPRLLSLMGEQAVGHGYMAQWHRDLPDRRAQEFLAAYETRFRPLDSNGGVVMAYDAVFLLAEAARRAGGVAAEPLRQALAATRGFQGASGSFHFDAERSAVRAVYWLRLQREGGALVKAIAP